MLTAKPKDIASRPRSPLCAMAVRSPKPRRFCGFIGCRLIRLLTSCSAPKLFCFDYLNVSTRHRARRSSTRNPASSSLFLLKEMKHGATAATQSKSRQCRGKCQTDAVAARAASRSRCHRRPMRRANPPSAMLKLPRRPLVKARCALTAKRPPPRQTAPRLPRTARQASRQRLHACSRVHRPNPCARNRPGPNYPVFAAKRRSFGH